MAGQKTILGLDMSAYDSKDNCSCGDLKWMDESECASCRGQQVLSGLSIAVISIQKWEKVNGRNAPRAEDIIKAIGQE